MNLLLWALQLMLALHTAIGAVWKFSNPSSTVPSLAALPQGFWQFLSVFELFCVVGLVLPAFYRPLAFLAPLAALGIAAEMLLYCGVSLSSGQATAGNIVYWLVVAAVGAFIAWGRFVLKPL